MRCLEQRQIVGVHPEESEGQGRRQKDRSNDRDRAEKPVVLLSQLCRDLLLQQPRTFLDGNDLVIERVQSLSELSDRQARLLMWVETAQTLETMHQTA